MFFVRFKQCETALAAGRLDEAFDLASQPAVRSHRQGQRLVDQLAKALIDRAKGHLAAGHDTAAEWDCRKAFALCGNTLDLVDLFAKVQDKHKERREISMKAKPVQIQTPIPLASAPAARDDWRAALKIPMQPPIAKTTRYLLHVDGSGSYLLLLGNTIRIGPSITGADLPLMTAPDTPSLIIARQDEDYFLQSATPIPVNNKSVQSKLLTAGDRIAIGPRCRISFTRPNAASASALLEVSGAAIANTPARHVILMHREIILGNSAAAHVRTDELRQPAMILAKSDGLALRGPDGHVVDLPLQSPIRVGTLSFVITSA